MFRRNYRKVCVIYADDDVMFSIIPLVYVDEYVYKNLISDFKIIERHEQNFCAGNAPVYCFENVDLWYNIPHPRGDIRPVFNFFYKDEHFDDWPDYFDDNFETLHSDIEQLSLSETVDTLVRKYGGEEYRIGLGYVPETFWAILKFLAKNNYPQGIKIDSGDLDTEGKFVPPFIEGDGDD